MNPSMLIAAALGATTMQTEAPPMPADAPITLATEASATGVTVRVVGLASTAIAARYSLEVASGGSRTVQSGSVRLRPGESAVLLTSRMGGDAQRPWTARLRVEPEGQASYEISRSS